MSVKAYDVIGSQWFVAMPTATAIIGTSGTAAFVGSLVFPVPFACKLVSARRYVTTGKTDAVAAHSVLIAKSVAGTGTITAMATFAYNGTQATGTIGTTSAVATGTNMHLAAGDLVGVSYPAGTVAATQTQAFSLEFAEILE